LGKHVLLNAWVEKKGKEGRKHALMAGSIVGRIKEEKIILYSVAKVKKSRWGTTLPLHVGQESTLPMLAALESKALRGRNQDWGTGPAASVWVARGGCERCELIEGSLHGCS